jgi:hypothetical protein
VIEREAVCCLLLCWKQPILPEKLGRFFLLARAKLLFYEKGAASQKVPRSTLGCGKGKSKRIKKGKIIEVNSIKRETIKLGLL